MVNEIADVLIMGEVTLRTFVLDNSYLGILRLFGVVVLLYVSKGNSSLEKSLRGI